MGMMVPSCHIWQTRTRLPSQLWNLPMKRILIVDDDVIVRRTVERILVRANYEVITAQSVAESVRYATDLSIDCAIIDYNLDGEDGLVVLAKLREMQPACLRILMTGSTDFPMVVDAVNRGEVLRVLPKPFEAPTLLQTIDGAFDAAKRMATVASAQQRATNLKEQAMLSECFEKQLLKLFLQPIVTPEGNPIAYEALLRSDHAVLDGPISILRIAERGNCVTEIGKRVFKLAADALATLRPEVSLFVNLHPLDLEDPDLLSTHIAPLRGLESRIVMEITERSRLQDMARWEESIALLTRRGFSIAIDDLGAGYNSLSMLADLQPQYIKIDMSLVRNIHLEPRKRRLILLMVTFANATGGKIIGEGVENSEEARALIDCGVHLLQGYLYGKPAPHARPSSRHN
jgi:EAL domain-containing protein (putative c-di-GMP-specific phosphodiesterase class I)/CheY-like chemotaxis protein